eukprot:gene6137-7362_t
MAHEQIEKVSEKKRSLASSQNRSSPRTRGDESLKRGTPELWEAHEVAMDTAGEKFVETMERVHTATLQNMSRIQEFDLKQVLSEMQQHSQSVRHLVMENFQGTREMEGQFAMTLFNTARQTYERGLNDLYETTTKHYRERMRVMKLANDQLVARERLAGRDEQKNVLKQQESLLQFTLEEKFDEERMMMQGLHSGVQARNDELRQVIDDRESEAAAETASVQAEEEAERPSSRLPSLNPTPEPRFRSFTPGSQLEPEEDDFPVAQGFEDTGLDRLQVYIYFRWQPRGNESLKRGTPVQLRWQPAHQWR